MKLRLLLNLIGFLSVFWMPWWVAIAISVVGIFLFRNFFEGVVMILFLESVYTTSSLNFEIFHMPLTITVLVYFLIMEFVAKRHLRTFEFNV